VPSLQCDPVHSRLHLEDQVVGGMDQVQGNKFKLKFQTTRCGHYKSSKLSHVLSCWSLCLECETEHFVNIFQVGLIIGRGGETIKSLQSRSGARIQVCCRSRMPWKPFNIVSYHLCPWTQWVGRNVTLFGFSIFNWWSIQVPTRYTIIKALTWWETIAIASLMFFVFCFLLFLSFLVWNFL